MYNKCNPLWRSSNTNLTKDYLISEREVVVEDLNPLVNTVYLFIFFFFPLQLLSGPESQILESD